eukprot:2504360-Pyramimonas_sp.AAC.1
MLKPMSLRVPRALVTIASSWTRRTSRSVAGAAGCCAAILACRASSLALASAFAWRASCTAFCAASSSFCSFSAWRTSTSS